MQELAAIEDDLKRTFYITRIANRIIEIYKKHYM
jgi:hypothetical protein